MPSVSLLKFGPCAFMMLIVGYFFGQVAKVFLLSSILSPLPPLLLSFFIHGIIVVLRKTVLLLAIVFNKHSLFTYIFIVLKHVYKYI